jgi:hypothetical protein
MTNSTPLGATAMPPHVPLQPHISRRGWMLLLALTVLVLALTSYIVVSTQALSALLIGGLIVALLYFIARSWHAIF